MLDFIFPQVLNSEYFQASFRKTNAGATGPILDIRFICTKIKGNIVSLTNSEESIKTNHQGMPMNALTDRIEFLIGSMMG
jgi:hypothetical protein